MRLLPPILATCAALLSLLHGTAHAQEPVAETVQAPRRINAPSTDVGVGFHTIRFRTENGGAYSLHGMTTTFDYWVGRKFGFMLHAEAFFPMRGAQTAGGVGYRGSLRQDYEQNWGLDGSLMVGMHHDVAPNVHFYTGAGVHLQSLRLNDATLSAIEVISMGVGGVARLRYDLHPHVHLSGIVAAAIDPLDLIKHRNRVVVLFPVTFGVSLGAHF